jgi:hypothetical protein
MRGALNQRLKIWRGSGNIWEEALKMHRLLCFLALVLAPGAGAQITTWAGSYTSVTAISVPESTHGIDSTLLAM